MSKPLWMVSPVFHPESPLPFSHHLLGRVVHTLHNPITPSKHHHLALFLLLPTVKSPGPVCRTAATFRSLSYSVVLTAHSPLFLGLCQHSFASLLAALCLASPPSSVITHLLLHMPTQRIHPLPWFQLPVAEEDSHVWISTPKPSLQPQIFISRCPQDTWMNHKHLNSVWPELLTFSW